MLARFDGVRGLPQTRPMPRLVWPLTGLLLLLLASPASAVVRHASPDGVTSTSMCTTGEPPCSLQRAVETVAQPGDEVILAAGDYTVSGGLAISVSKAIFVHGAAGGPQPRVTKASPNLFNVSANGARLADLRLEAPGSVVRAASTTGTILLERLAVRAGAAGSGRAVELNYGGILRD